MDRALRNAADRLGFLAYSLLVSGGRPDWQLILGQPSREISAGGRAKAALSQNPFVGTVAFEVEQRPRDQGE